MLTIFLGMGLIGLLYWLPALGERLGIENIDPARRVAGILLGVYFIVDGNQQISMFVFLAGALLFCAQMFLVFRRIRQMKGEAL